MRRPRAASRRKPAAVIEPSGNAIAAATPNRSGVSGATCSGEGTRATAQHIDVYLTINRKSQAALEQLHDTYLHDWNSKRCESSGELFLHIYSYIHLG